MGDWGGSDDNPFAAPEGDSPFSDPSVAQASGSATMPEYDPFAGASGEAPAPAVKAPAAARSPAPSDAPDWATPAAEQPKQNTATADEKNRAKNYDAAESQPEEQVRKDPGNRPANWPPFPMKCVWPFKPCFHHDFRGELPAYGYSLTKQGYYYWCAYFFTLFWNAICVCVAQSSVKNDTGLGLAFAYLFIFGPLSYLCWFQSLYKAIMKDGGSNLTWGWFFFSYLFQLVFVALMALGYPGLGGVGVWTASVVVQDDAAVGIVLFSCAICWVLLALFQAYHMKWALSIFKTSGGSFEGAQKEAQQLAVAGAVAGAVAK